MWPFDYFKKKRENEEQKFKQECRQNFENHKKETFADKWESSVSHESIFKKSVSFRVERFEEWQQGKCIASGILSFDMHFIADATKISVNVPNASKFKMHASVSFDFANSNVLRDRVQYVNAPGISEDPTRPIVLHIFVKDGKIGCIRFAMSYPDRIVEFYGYQIKSEFSKPSDFIINSSDEGDAMEYKLTFLSSLLNIASCDGDISESEMNVIYAYIQREGLSEADLVRVVTNPKSISSKPPKDKNLRATHLRDIVTLAMVDGEFTSAEYALCKHIALGLGFNPEVIDLIRKELNNKIGANI